MACIHGSNECVEILLKFNARRDLHDATGMTPAELATSAATQAAAIVEEAAGLGAGTHSQQSVHSMYYFSKLASRGNSKGPRVYRGDKTVGFKSLDLVVPTTWLLRGLMFRQ